MAHWAGTGPTGKHCKDCWFRGYHRRVKKKSAWSAACEKFYKLTNRHGPAIRGGLHACKYFFERPKS
jgi:hypothetical protein